MLAHLFHLLFQQSKNIACMAHCVSSLSLSLFVTSFLRVSAEKPNLMLALVPSLPPEPLECLQIDIAGHWMEQTHFIEREIGQKSRSMDKNNHNNINNIRLLMEWRHVLIA